MNPIRKSIAATLLVGALAAAAQAGQTFSFANPYAGGGSSYVNSQFETGGIYSMSTPAPYISDIHGSKLINLRITTFDDNGLPSPPTPTGANSVLLTGVSYEVTDPFGNDTINAISGPSGFNTDGGKVRFFTASDSNLLTITFNGAGLSNQSFGGTAGGLRTVTFSGSKVTTSQTDNGKFSFSFPAPIFSDPANPSDPVHFTSDFTSSVGKTSPVPEPSSIAALALGGLALLRRKRRA